MTKLIKPDFILIKYIYIVILSLLFSIKIHSESINFIDFTLNKIDNEILLNYTKKNLIKPSGKLGFLKVINGNFYFPNNKKIKFYGTNLCYDSCFPEKEDAIKIAKIISSFGFNAVRFHHMDSYPFPKGIFNDETLTDLSPVQLDKLDYFIYTLKNEGIYINLNLLVHRSFENNPNVIEGKNLKRGAKPISLFDENIINEQKKYTRELLTHYNPYTNLKYIDDPSIILIEMINETSLIRDFLHDKLHFNSNGYGIPKYYSDSLDDKWNKWFKNKYPNIHFFTRPRFKQNKDIVKSNFDFLYEFYTDLQTIYFTEMQDFLIKDIGVKIPIIGIGGYIENEDLLSMLKLNVFDIHYYIDHPIFPMGKSWDKKSFYLQSKSNIHDNLKNLTKRLKILNKYNKAITITEWNHCYPSPLAYETPLLFAFKARKYKVDALFQFTFLDTLDSFKENKGLQSYFNLYNNPQQLLLHMISSNIFLSNEQIKLSVFNDYYTLKGNNFYAIIGRLKNQKIKFENNHFQLNSDGVFIVSKIDKNNIFTLSFGEIKNKNSKFNNDGTFNWGEAPVMLKNFHFTFLNEESNKIKIKSIKNNFTLNNILLKQKNGYIIFNSIDNPLLIIEKL